MSQPTTMRVLYFPFTHAGPGAQNSLRLVFNPVEYLCLDVPGTEDMRLAGFVPLRPGDKALAEADMAAARYLEWAKIHQGNEQNLKAILSDSPYITDDTDVTRIKSTLRRGAGNSAGAGQQEDPARDLLFLKLAQTCDRQQEGLDGEIRALDDTRSAMLEELKGLGDTDSGSGRKTALDFRDPGSQMTRSRIECWARVLDAAGQMPAEDETALFVTTSPAVFDYFQTNCRELAKPLDINQIKVHEFDCESRVEWQEQMQQWLYRAVQKAEKPEAPMPGIQDGCRQMLHLKAGLFSGEIINRLFKRSQGHIAVCLVRIKG